MSSNYGNWDQAVIDGYLNDIQSQTNQLTTDWNAWYLFNNPPPPTSPPVAQCTLQVGSCPATQIANTANSICACHTIVNWEKLTTVQADLPGLLVQINGLTNVDATAVAQLKKNWDDTNGSLNTIQSYVVTSSSSLDENYVQAMTDQTNSWYASIKATLASLTGTGTATCSITCPTNWVVDTASCSCSCNIPSCPSTDAIDVYACACAAKTSCTMIPSSCTSPQILNYAGCACVARP